jgi:hypothetical protein
MVSILCCDRIYGRFGRLCSTCQGKRGVDATDVPVSLIYLLAICIFSAAVCVVIMLLRSENVDGCEPSVFLLFRLHTRKPDRLFLTRPGSD